MFGHNSILSLDSFPAFLNDPRNPNKMLYVFPKQIFEIILKSTWISHGLLNRSIKKSVDKQAGYNRIFMDKVTEILLFA